MWLNIRLPPCHSPSSVWYCGERATRQDGSQAASIMFVPTIQPTTGSFTTHAWSTVAVQVGAAASAAGAAALAAAAAASSAIRPIRRIRDLRSRGWGIVGYLAPQVLRQVARPGDVGPLLPEHGDARPAHEGGRIARVG